MQMSKEKIKKIVLIACLVLSVVMIVITCPFGMKVMDQAGTFQKKAFNNLGVNMSLFAAMDTLSQAKEGTLDTAGQSDAYVNLVNTSAADFNSEDVTRFNVMLILFVVGIVLFLLFVILLKKIKYLVLTIGALIMVFPFYWMVSSSLKTSPEMNIFPPAMAPGNWLNFENYKLAMETAPFGTYFINSIVVCVLSVACVMFTTILASFAFSRLEFPGRDLLFTLLLSMMMVPFELLVITNYQTVIQMGLIGGTAGRIENLAALVVPFTSSIFYTYILRNFFMSVPDSLYRSAQVDGSSDWQYLWKVMVPMAMPSLVTILLLNAMASWNSFMWPKLIISNDLSKTLPWALVTFTTEAGSHDEQIMAAATLVILPMLILFLFARKQIVKGVSRGGIKG